MHGWCSRPIRRTIRAVTSGWKGTSWWHAMPTALRTRVSGSIGRSSSTAARRGSFRCCRCCSARSRRGACVVTSTRGNGSTSARQIGWRGWTRGSARREAFDVPGIREADGPEPALAGVLRPWRKMSAMASLKDIPVVADGAPARPESPRSGEKYLTSQGFTAIRDGIKASAGGAAPPLGSAGRVGKPSWLKAKAPSGVGFQAVKGIVKEHRLATVCEEAKCPNIGECWNAGTATIMLMGAVCTRACRFCSVDTGNPRGWLDVDEPENAARSVELMKLKYVVLTSVDRDDLPDGGAAHYAACVRAIKSRNPGTAVEALTPDFGGVLADVSTVVDSGVEVFAQNIETVRRLTQPVRDARAGYEQTLAVLAHAKRHRPAVLTKSSLMLGLGETDAEIDATLGDLRAAGVDLVTLGQYLRPTLNHLPVERFVTPEEFDRYRERALACGFLECVSGPLVRSSYRAEQALNRNNAGLDNSRLAR